MWPHERGAGRQFPASTRGSPAGRPARGEEPGGREVPRHERGSHPPGTFWYYNNWDFNVLGEIYERVTGHSFYTAVEHDLAGPLGWRDFDPMRDARYQYAAESPRFPAYNLSLSARDLATVGQLYLDQGVLNGRPHVAAGWVSESTTMYSTTGRRGIEGGYGYLWWGATNKDGADPAGIPLGSSSRGHCALAIIDTGLNTGNIVLWPV